MTTEPSPPGSAERLPLRVAIRDGGAGLLGVLLLIGILDEFPRAAVVVLAPDIQATFDISDTALLGMIGLVGVALVLTTLPAAALGDRMRRTRVVGYGTVAVAVFTAFTGLAPNPFLMGVALTGTGMGVGSRLPRTISAPAMPLETCSAVEPWRCE